MADKKLGTLLSFLAAAALFSATAAGAFLFSENITALRGRIARYEKGIRDTEARLEEKSLLAARRDELLSEIAGRTGRMYFAGETDAYGFGILVKSALESRGITAASYRTADGANARILEFTCSGSADAFMKFFEEISARDKKWIVHSLEMKSDGKGALGTVMRIGYEERVADNR